MVMSWLLNSMATQPKTEGSALAARRQTSGVYQGNYSLRQPQSNSRNNDSPTNGQRSGNRPWCDHCKILGHTKEICWKLHGKPQTRQHIRSSGHAAETKNNTFNQEQMEALQRMLQATIQPTIGGNNTVVVAQSDHMSTALNARLNTCDWIVDSGATDHMTGNINVFDELQPKPNTT